MPRNLEEVLERAKEEEALRQALRNVIAKLPASLRDDVDVRLLIEGTRRRRISIVHLINRRSEFSTDSKDYEFSRTTIRALWAAGLTDMRRTLANPNWGNACDAERGMRTYDLLQ